MRALTVCALLLALGSARARVYERCELARELATRLQVTLSSTAIWVCLAYHESRLDTAALGRLNGDGSHDHGLFQISELYWCREGSRGGACDLDCASLRDDDLADDVECAQRIHREHQGLAGDGYTAWAVYRAHCQGKNIKKYIAGCDDPGRDSFDDLNLAEAYFEESAKEKFSLTTPPTAVFKQPSYPIVFDIDKLLPITTSGSTEHTKGYSQEDDITTPSTFTTKPTLSTSAIPETTYRTTLHSIQETTKKYEPSFTSKYVPSTPKYEYISSFTSTSKKPDTTTTKKITLSPVFTFHSTKSNTDISRHKLFEITTTRKPSTQYNLFTTSSPQPSYSHVSAILNQVNKSPPLPQPAPPYRPLYPASVVALHSKIVPTEKSKFPSPYVTSKQPNFTVFKFTQFPTVSSLKGLFSSTTSRNKIDTSSKLTFSTISPFKYSTPPKKTVFKSDSTTNIALTSNKFPVNHSVVNSDFPPAKRKFTSFDPLGVFRYY